MKIFGIDFPSKKNTASILSSFLNAIDELKAHAVASKERAAENADLAYEYTERHDEEVREADRATAAAKKLEALFK